MVYALILVVVGKARLTVTTTESATTLKMRITVRLTADATMMEYVNLDEEKTNTHVSMIVDVTRMRYVNLTGGKPLVHVKIVRVIQVAVILVGVQTPVQEGGWDQVVVNILRVHATIQMVQFGQGQNVHAPLDKSALKDIAEMPMKRIVYHPGVPLGMTTNNDVSVQVNI